ncbi:MAG: ABC transporter ATP-binding protein/permease [Armatimonadetes bacterium]|nr:ABC transporter ATP-binding protein/permease [Armatimonadota bacterium]CUU36133.1 ATP-binding cassette, subfamily B, MsbA [Armatimonadetes bacterium DC]
MERIERRFWRYVLQQWKPLVVALLCSAGVTAITGLTAYLLEQVIRSMDMRDSAMLNRVSLTVIGVFALKWFFSYGQVYYLALAGQRMMARLREDIFAHLQRLPLSFFQSRQIGSIQSILTNDVPLVQNAVLLVRDVLDAPLRIVAFTAYIFYLNWRLALLALLFLPLIATLIRRMGRQIHRITHQTQGALAEISALVQETLAGVRVIKAFATEDRQIERFVRQNRQVLSHSLRGERRRARLRPTVEFIGAVSIALVLWFGGQQVAAGHMTTGQLLSFLFLLHQIAQAASGVGAIQFTRKQVRAAAERIFREVLDVEPEVYDPPNAITLPPVQGAIQYENVWFCYPSSEQHALKGVSFEIQPGEVVALVGHSGAGKSTLVDLLLRFYSPTQGRILIDNHDIQQVRLESLRSQIGVVPQQTVLFVGTVAENIAYSQPNAPMEAIEQAARQAHAHEFIEQLPNGYHTLIGDKGVRLSGGESQRIAIARALLRNPRILILDEATASLDPISEQMIRRVIEEGRGVRTTLIIAHRWSTVQIADRILVLHQGRLVEQGTHAELMQKGGYYAQLYRAAQLEVL